MSVRYPYNIPVGFHFDVIVKGYESDTECVFSEVSGLNVKIDVENISEGGVNNYLHKFPKKANYENLVLKRGLMKGTDLITWVNNAINEFKFEPKSVQVRLLDENNKPTVNWNLVQAYPVGMRSSEFKANDNSIVFETFELAYERFTREEK